MRPVPAVLAMMAAGCGGRTVPVAGPPADRVPPGVVQRPLVLTYPVTGSDLATLTASLRAGGIVQGKRRFAGFHESNLTWQFQFRFESTRCGVDRATVVLESRMTLPEWRPPATIDSVLRTQWEAYLGALRSHELVHRVHAVQGAVRLREALLAVRTARCADIAAVANAEGQRLLARFKAESDRYDEETRHGATQGAVWPPRPD